MGLPLISRFNELVLGISMGYVWVADGRLVGNVSIYPADWPQEMGSAWIFANVCVHPDYQRRGIARQLMQASMEMVRSRGARHAILQVDAANEPAINLYRQLGYIDERTFITWRRSTASRVPDPMLNVDKRIARRRPREWRDEMAFAERLRPHDRGGIGWLRPPHRRLFQRTIWRRMFDWLNLRSVDHLVIHDDGQIAATMWVEDTLGGSTKLTLMVEPRYQGLYDEMMINSAVRRFGRSPITIEHPADETTTSQILQQYRFSSQRSVVHMRWDAR
jgi:RimJ/RimL family protein N-acetyltransferase